MLIALIKSAPRYFAWFTVVIFVSSMAAKPALWHEISIPDSLLQSEEWKGQQLHYGGDMRIGDLDGDGRLDFLVFRSEDAGLKPSFMGAFTLEGTVLWQVGEGGDQPARPGSVVVYDFDGDGADEVLHFWHDPMVESSVENMGDVLIQIRRGTDGKVLRESRPEVLATCEGEGPNWVHQRLLIANLRGESRPRDFVVKLGEKVLAFDDALNLLWSYEIPWNEYAACSAYIPAVGDIDGDGRDEVTGGYYLLDDDGEVMWAKQLGPNMDSVAIAPWDEGRMRVVASGGGYVLDCEGVPLIHLDNELVPHGQEVRTGDFDASSPGQEMIIRWNGHNQEAMLVSVTGEVLRQFELNESPNNTGMELVYWNGPSESPLLYNGGMLWSAGDMFAELPGLPDPVGPSRMGWYHCIPVDIAGDGREEIVLYNPWESVVRIYGAEDVDSSVSRTYRSTSRQYNARLMD